MLGKTQTAPVLQFYMQHSLASERTSSALDPITSEVMERHACTWSRTCKVPFLSALWTPTVALRDNPLQDTVHVEAVGTESESGWTGLAEYFAIRTGSITRLKTNTADVIVHEPFPETDASPIWWKRQQSLNISHKQRLSSTNVVYLPFTLPFIFSAIRRNRAAREK